MGVEVLHKKIIIWRIRSKLINKKSIKGLKSSMVSKFYFILEHAYRNKKILYDSKAMDSTKFEKLSIINATKTIVINKRNKSS